MFNWLKVLAAKKAGQAVGNELAPKPGLEAGPQEVLDFSWAKNLGKAAWHSLSGALVLALAGAVLAVLGQFGGADELSRVGVPPQYVPLVVFLAAALTNYIKQAIKRYQAKA